jgi:hypothetical protein
MSIEYTWLVKNLNSDMKGYANSLYLELEGSDGVNSTTSNLMCAFGGDDYKPKSSWSNEDIDLYAEGHKQVLQDIIDEKLQLMSEGNL